MTASRSLSSSSPAAGKAEVLIDGTPSGEIDLDGAAGRARDAAMSTPTTRRARLPRNRGARAERRAGDGDGRRRRSRRRRRLLPQSRLPRRDGAIAAEARGGKSRRRSASAWRPTSIVLAFGTNEGFNDNLDIADYTAQYEQIVRRVAWTLRPRAAHRHDRAARRGAADGGCHARRRPGLRARRRVIAADAGGGHAASRRRPSSALVREAQRKLAEASRPISGIGPR